MKMYKSEYETGDIVYVSEYTYSDGKQGTGHLFVIIDVNRLELVPVEYFGMIVSSHREKSKTSSNFEYNEPLNKSDDNGLTVDSIVKCDEMYTIPPKNIVFKIGVVDVDDYLRFIEAYNKVLKGLEEALNS